MLYYNCCYWKLCCCNNAIIRGQERSKEKLLQADLTANENTIPQASVTRTLLSGKTKSSGVPAYRKPLCTCKRPSNDATVVPRKPRIVLPQPFVSHLLWIVAALVVLKQQAASRTVSLAAFTAAASSWGIFLHGNSEHGVGGWRYSVC